MPQVGNDPNDDPRVLETGMGIGTRWIHYWSAIRTFNLWAAFTAVVAAADDSSNGGPSTAPLRDTVTLSAFTPRNASSQLQAEVHTADCTGTEHTENIVLQLPGTRLALVFDIGMWHVDLDPQP